MLQDDNKIIFDKPQNFYRDTTKIKNDVIRKVITVNDKIQYYACVTDITYSDGGITAALLGRDDEEYEVSITAEIGDDEVYPSYLAVDSTQPTYIQAVQIVILEGLRLLTDDDSTLPESEEINELQATITRLEKDLSDAGDTITTLTGQLETAQGQVGTLTGQLEQAQSHAIQPGDIICPISQCNINELEFMQIGNAPFANGPTGKIQTIALKLEKTWDMGLRTDIEFNGKLTEYTITNITLGETNITENLEEQYLNLTISNRSPVGAGTQYLTISSNITPTFTGPDYPDVPADPTPLSITITRDDGDNQTTDFTFETTLDFTNNTFITEEEEETGT